MKQLLAIIFLIAGLTTQSIAQTEPVDKVYPYLDAAHSRWFYFSSACRPFGMVSLFPDNNINGEWESGYRYSVDTVKDFSHIHEWQLSGVALMPISCSEAELPKVAANYASVYNHSSETIKPGYHALSLNRYNIRAELTASNRVGFHRYHFPKGKVCAVVFDLGGKLGPSDIIDGGFELSTNNQLNGYVVNGPTSRRPKNCPVFFSAAFSLPIKKIILSQQGQTTENLRSWNGKNGRLIVVFDEKSSNELLMKVGISYTNQTGAQRNMNSEIPDWDFDMVKLAAQNHWNNMLSRIRIEGGTDQQQRRFYTDLWHAIQGRRTISDVDGKYSDFTGSERLIKQLPLDSNAAPRFNMYNSDSFWGAQWTLNTLWQLVYPEIAKEFCYSFLEYYKNGGFIPRGPSGGNYTFVMTGAASTPFFVSAWQKNILNSDTSFIYNALKKSHMPGGIMSKVGYEHKTSKGGGLEAYIEKGYVPYPLSDTIYGAHQDGAAITLENAYQDWCLTQLAKALGKTDDYAYFAKRSENFRNLYNPASGYMQPKDKVGKWKAPYDPLLYDNGFVEGNGAQFIWFVPHNLPALFELMGGKDSAQKRLNRQFERERNHRFCNEHPENIEAGLPKFINEKRTWVNYSNQPFSQAAFIFNYTGTPWLTQYWSRTVVDSVFSKLSPYYGYNGDEDQGLMGSLAVLMKIGIFQMAGGCDENPKYELGSPLFDKVTIHLNPDFYKAETFVIETKNNGASAPYIHSAQLNGKSLESFYFRHSDIVNGAKLQLEMSNKPSIPDNKQ